MMTPGTVVGGKYLLSRLLGQGAMGEVWAAVNQATGGAVALKLLSRPGEELRHRLLREARACGRLRHRNVIDVHDVAVLEDGEPFLVMELLAGETLAGLLERSRRLLPHRAARIARDVARALEAAHRAGIVHRDLKPANVFLHREDGAEDVVVKVLDFGVSKSADASDALARALGTAVGSPAYMSPEQARAAADLDHRTDLWSIGVVLFEMLAGRRPFDGDARQLAGRIAASPAPRVSEVVEDVDPGLAGIVACCLEREPARRFGSAGELAAALDRHARPPLPFARPPAWPRTLVDGDDMPTMKRDRGILRALPAAPADATPVDPAGPTLPDPLEAPTLSRGGPLTVRLPRDDAGILPAARAGSRRRRRWCTRPARPRRRSRIRALGAVRALGRAVSSPAPRGGGRVGALTLVLSGVPLVRVLSRGSPAPAAAPEAVVGAEPLPFATPASGEVTAPRDDPRPGPTASASAPPPSPPAPDMPPGRRRGPRAAPETMHGGRRRACVARKAMRAEQVARPRSAGVSPAGGHPGRRAPALLREQWRGLLVSPSPPAFPLQRAPAARDSAPRSFARGCVSSTRSRVGVGALALVVCCGVERGRAGGGSRRLARDGGDLRRRPESSTSRARRPPGRGTWDRARLFYVSAWRAQHHWQIAGSLGHAELALGLYRDAAEHLAFFLRETRFSGPSTRATARC